MRDGSSELTAEETEGWGESGRQADEQLRAVVDDLGDSILEREQRSALDFLHGEEAVVRRRERGDGVDLWEAAGWRMQLPADEWVRERSVDDRKRDSRGGQQLQECGGFLRLLLAMLRNASEESRQLDCAEGCGHALVGRSGAADPQIESAASGKMVEHEVALLS